MRRKLSEGAEDVVFITVLFLQEKLLVPLCGDRKGAGHVVPFDTGVYWLGVLSPLRRGKSRGLVFDLEIRITIRHHSHSSALRSPACRF